jgi:hypothetical protein
MLLTVPTCSGGLSGNATDTGNCWGDGIRGCGVFVEGSSCRASGNEIWNTYQSIRKVGGCKKCGGYKRDDGCKIKIDYVVACSNPQTPDLPPGNG